MTTNETWKHLVQSTISEFFADRVPRLGAALAFYAAFSIAPLLVVAASVASLFFAADAVEGQLRHELLANIGKQGAATVQEMVSAAAKSHHAGITSSVLSAAALFFGATGVLIELKASMNLIWGVEVRPELGMWGGIKDSVFAFPMALGIALLLLISIILTTLLSALGNSIAVMGSSARLVDFVVSSIVITLLFMLIFKYLPDTKVLWRDVWIGAFVTSFLFTIGKHVVGFYLAHSTVTSAYGAISSLMVFLLWTYYSSQILFLGAEFTQVYATMRGRRIQPSSNAQIVNRERIALAESVRHE